MKTTKEAMRWFKSVYEGGEGFDVFGHISGISEAKLLENRLDAIANTIALHAIGKGGNPSTPLPLTPSPSYKAKYFLITWKEMQEDMDGEYFRQTKSRYYYITHPRTSSWDAGPCNLTTTGVKSYNCWEISKHSGCLLKVRHMKIESPDSTATLPSLPKIVLLHIPTPHIYPIPGVHAVITKSGFWLIKKSEADFVYAIFHSSMFKAWCELTACLTWCDENGNLHPNSSSERKGCGHFSPDMWDTFYFLVDYSTKKQYVIDLSEKLKDAKTNDNEKAIKIAQGNLDNLVDDLVSVQRFGKDYDARREYLADRFCGGFPSLKNDVMNLCRC